MSYDPKCYDLAAAFLEDEPELATEKNKCKLAQHIQDTIEDWITYTVEIAVAEKRGW